MKQTTRKHLIIQHYNKLLLDIEKVYKTDILLPNLDEDFDIVEILFYFSYYFPVQYVDDFHIPLKKIIEEKNIKITDSEYELIYPLIKEFLIFFKSL